MSFPISDKNSVRFLAGFFCRLLVTGLSLCQFKPVQAQTRPSADLKICESETSHFCGDKKEFSQIAACLVQHEADLSKTCKQEIERFLEIRKQASARGGGALTSFGGLNAFGPPLPLFSYEGRLIPAGKSTEQIENRANLSLPIYKTAEDTYALSLAAGQIHLGDTLVLDSGLPVSTDFTRLEIGGQYMHNLPAQRTWGLRASVGYAGDQPSLIPKDLSYSISGSYGFPGTKGYWVLLVFVANNSPLINYFPIPGAIYIYKTENFSGVFGFPINSLQWTPVDPWVFSLSIFGISLQSEAAYGRLGRPQTFLSYGYTEQSFIPDVRPDDRDRLTIHDQRVALGYRVPFKDTVLVELQGGRSYDRSIYVGNGPLNKDVGSVEMAPDWFVGWSLKAAF
jgi:hypothetical protein